MRVYITHCSAKKAPAFVGSLHETYPDILYTASPTQRFMRTCKSRGVNWAIFSDLYGVWFPNTKHAWYEKDPDTVTFDEYRKLLDSFYENLNPFKEILFYANPRRFHPLYKQLISQTLLRDRIRLITHLSQII
jgi:hypothetical protein